MAMIFLYGTKRSRLKVDIELAKDVGCYGNECIHLELKYLIPVTTNSWLHEDDAICMEFDLRCPVI